MIRPSGVWKTWLGNGLFLQGDTKPLRMILKDMGGKWNPTLSGWIFPGNKNDDIDKMSEEELWAIIEPKQFQPRERCLAALASLRLYRQCIHPRQLASP